MLRVLRPESRLGADRCRDDAVGPLDYAYKPLAFADFASEPVARASAGTMDYADDHRSSSRTLMPIRSNSSYISPAASHSSSANAPYALAPSPASMRHDGAYPTPYSADSPVQPGSSYFSSAHTPKTLGLVKLSSALPPHSLAHQRFTSASYADSQTSDSDRGLPRTTSASPVAPNVASIPPVPSNLNANMQPTWHGFVHTTQDALTIVEACLNGTLVHCPRRPHDRERASLIRSGSVFVYEESTSGIKRWTDGLSWSPSRIMGNFLVYRELERPFPPGEKKRANRQRSKSARTEPYSRTSAPAHYSDEPPYEIPDSKDRKITGSLVDSYDFKRGGLLKRTLSVSVNGCTHHLIAYYTIEDAKDQSTLYRPGHDARLANCHPRKELITDQKFRSPIQDPDDVVPYPPYMPIGPMPSAHPLGSYASQYHPQQPYQPVLHPLGGGIHSAYHTTSQSMPNVHAASSSSSSGYPALPSSSPSPQSVFGNMGNGTHLIPGARPQGLVSPLGSLHLSQSPGHQPRSGFDNVSSGVQGSVSLDYPPFPHESSYTTAPGSGFSQNFGFDQPSHGMSGQGQYHSGMSEMSEDSQVGTEQIFGEASGHMPTSSGFPCYSGSESQHSRHDTLGAFDEKAPQYSNHFS